MLLYGCTLAFLSILSIFVSAKNVTYDFDVGYAYVNPDNPLEREVITINGQFPSPTIEVDQYDTLIINVHNSLNVPTAIHAHGFAQNGTNIMDGVNMDTQCPIPPGQNFTYEFNASWSGTYWYHSHYKGQYMDGLRAPLIVHASDEPYAYDEEITVSLSDWYHNVPDINLAWFLSDQNLDGTEPVPQSGLINDNFNSSFNFETGKTYRLRLINMSGFSRFFFSLDGHDLEVIEVDGVDTEKYSTKSDNDNTNYYMHADLDLGMYDYVSSDLAPNITAPVYYNNNTNIFAASEDIGSASDFDDIELVPLDVIEAVSPDATYNMTIEFDITTDGLNRGMFNRVPYISPYITALFSAVTGGMFASNVDYYGPQGSVYVLRHMDMVELILNNSDDDDHPFHLHGHKVQLVARGTNGLYNETGVNNVKWYTKNPMRRDTFQVPGNGFAIVRFRADNPGAWIFHCHVDWHLYSGLAAVFIEGPEEIQEMYSNIPMQMQQQCIDLGLNASGNAAGRQGLDLRGAPAGIYLPANETV
ncbi:MAG: multicopper oxidase-domain-containing protein [Benjaminiella poitrasii]|nr:MAG: multicopper oxidase-domain-containing protein [Benjaminiella poitrasii]